MDSKSLLIKNAWICQVENEIVNPILGNVIIEDGIISEIGEIIPKRNLDTIDAKGRVITIPNTNFHDHIYSRLAKGLRLTGTMNDFTEILENLWWKIDMLLDHDMIRASAKMAAIESIRNGVTYIFDHHASPSNTIGSLNCIKETLSEFNIRNVLCFETSDRNGEHLKHKAIKENQDFFLYSTTDDSKAMFGLHASFTLDDSTLNSVKDFLAKNDIGIHIHICEDESDREFSLKKYSKSPVQRLLDFNLIKEKSILVHGVHIAKDEFNLLKDRKHALAINPDSNLNNSVGLPTFADIPEETSILCGTDGMHANIPRSQKQFFLMLRNQGFSFDKAFYFFRKMYFDQLNYVRKYFPDFSSLHVNERADMIIWDYVPPTPINASNFFGHYIYGILERPILTVIQNGNVLMNNFNLLNVDEVEINNYIYEQGKRLVQSLD